MLFQRIKSDGLAHNSYFIGSHGEAAVIDPARDCQVYLDIAQRHGLRLKYAFETHRNEDYTVGSIELEHFTGAIVFHGPGLDFRYGNTLKHGQEFQVGDLRLTAMHTPGHTDESTSYVLADLAIGPDPVMVFTGDALFVGEVGRVDLYGPGEARRLAERLYDSIFNRILPLGDGVILCPAHGGGSVCGSRISERDESTLGIERQHNPVLQKSRGDFIAYKVAERLERPPYFSQMEKHNLEGPPLLRNLPIPAPLGSKAFIRELEQGAVIVDTRMPSSFGGAYIEGSYSIWLEGLPSFAGWMLGYDRPVLLVMEDSSHLEKAVRYLVRLAYDNIAGYLRGGVETWYNAALPTQHLGLLTVQELRDKLDRGERIQVLDVRDDREFEEGHIEGALHIYVGHLEKRIDEVPRDVAIAAVCSVGNRASLGASILRRAGFKDVSNVLGSMTAWRAAAHPMVRA